MSNCITSVTVLSCYDFYKPFDIELSTSPPKIFYITPVTFHPINFNPVSVTFYGVPVTFYPSRRNL